MTPNEIRKFVEEAVTRHDDEGIQLGMHALVLKVAVDDLAMLVKRLVQAGRAHPDMRGFGLISISAMDYLARNNLAGEVMREDGEKSMP
jgi:hypothetical protein